MAASQSRIVLSILPVSTVLLSGLIATACIRPPWAEWLADLFACVDVPQKSCLVGTSRHERSAVGAECDPLDSPAQPPLSGPVLCVEPVARPSAAWKHPRSERRRLRIP